MASMMLARLSLVDTCKGTGVSLFKYPMTDAVVSNTKGNVMAQTIYGNIKAFCTSQENAPSKALALVLSATDHMIAHRDWDALAYFLGHAPSNMRGTARRIVGEVLGGVTYDSTSKVAKAHRCKGVFTLGDNFGPTDKLQVLRDLVANGEKITGKEVAEAFPKAVADKSHDELVQAMAKNIKARMERDNITWQEIVAQMVGVTEPAH